MGQSGGFHKEMRKKRLIDLIISRVHGQLQPGHGFSFCAFFFSFLRKPARVCCVRVSQSVPPGLPKHTRRKHNRPCRAKRKRKHRPSELRYATPRLVPTVLLQGCFNLCLFWEAIYGSGFSPPNLHDLAKTHLSHHHLPSNCPRQACRGR